jgi:hypothetical protein
MASLFPAGKKSLGRAKRAEVPLSTVTVTMVGEEPLSVTGPGTEQTKPAGAPLQVNDTVCLNPPAGATARVNFALPPGETVAVDEPEEVIEKS